ncbi:MAG TPA: glycosyltransferase family 39 protein [Candidatus Omnitrophota bacterium]|nr:glycosyltransferase family 39 protein [Candidatus Omnitrophota bacterium]
MTQFPKERTVVLFLFLFSLFVFTRGLMLHGVEYRDDEIFYYQSTKEMVQEGDLLSPTYFGEDRFQKPILFYWLVILAYKVFGVNWFAARVTASLFAALTVVLTYLLAREFFARRVAFLSSMILMSMPLFLRHAKNVVPDMPLNLFIVAAVYCVVLFLKDTSKQRYNLLFYLCCSLGFMVKGFAAMVIPLGAAVIYALCLRRKGLIKELRILRGIFLVLIIVIPWFIYMASRHGGSYLEYMIFEETKNRIVGYDQTHFLVVQIKRFAQNIIFYGRTLLAYYLPWSLIAVLALVFAPFSKKEPQENERNGLRLCYGWMVLTLFIFANMYFKISHYVLVMTVPFAIWVAFIILESRSKIINGTIITMLLIIFGIGLFAFSFLAVFLASAPKWLLLVFLGGYLATIGVVAINRDPIILPVIVSLFILFVFSQTNLMAEAGVTSHATLQRFSKTILEHSSDDYVVGVGSHDIHEKEFQVYFDKKIIKAGHSHAGTARKQLQELFQTDREVYCLLTQKDYNEYLPLFEPFQTKVIQEEFMVRKRMKLDEQFAWALLGLDQETVRGYLMEKIVLLKKENDG